jgi:hypothetical protein
MLLMLNYPDVQHRIQDEVDSVVGRSRPPSLKDRLLMSYTEAAILETLRYSTVAPLAVPRCSLEDVVFRGYSIPKGSMVNGAKYKRVSSTIFIYLLQAWEPNLWKQGVCNLMHYHLLLKMI